MPRHHIRLIEGRIHGAEIVTEDGTVLCALPPEDGRSEADRIRDARRFRAAHETADQLRQTEQVRAFIHEAMNVPQTCPGYPCGNHACTVAGCMCELRDANAAAIAWAFNGPEL